jgi:hypothetical protein
LLAHPAAAAEEAEAFSTEMVTTRELQRNDQPFLVINDSATCKTYFTGQQHRQLKSNK